MSLSRIDAVAEALLRARRDHCVLPAAPLADALGNAGDAYAVQQRVAARCDWYASSLPQYWKAGGPWRTTPLAFLHFRD